MTGREKVDRLALVVTGESCEKLLGIPKLENGTGQKMVEAIQDFTRKWKMDNLVEIICFDTTSSNTGIHRGAAFLLEHALGRKLLFFPCRHHISELLLKAVFELNFGRTSAPSTVMFDRFALKWKDIDTNNFMSGITDEKVRSAINNNEIQLLKMFCIDKLNYQHDRSDYKELLELALVFIGEEVPNFKKFRLPGASSHARFMAKAIYAYKIFIFRDQYQLTANELSGIRNVCIFLTKIYVQYWFGCTSAIEAPRRDLQLIKNAIDYYDKRVSAAMLEKLRNHLWYLAEESVGLAFFDEIISLEMKREMVNALGNIDLEDVHEEYNSPKRINVTMEGIKIFDQKDLSYFLLRKPFDSFCGWKLVLISCELTLQCGARDMII